MSSLAEQNPVPASANQQPSANEMPQRLPDGQVAGNAVPSLNGGNTGNSVPSLNGVDPFTPAGSVPVNPSSLPEKKLPDWR